MAGSLNQRLASLSGSSGPVSSSLKTGSRPVQETVRAYKEGDVLFQQGERGRELFILREGEISITLGEREDAVELARLGPGAIIGEMALLDGAPRSATATATKPTKSLIINEMIFNAVSQGLPVWLRSIIKIITARLRDSNKFIGHSILKNREKGVASLLVKMAADYRRAHPDSLEIPLDYFRVVEEIQFTTRLKRGDAEKNLTILSKRRLLDISDMKEGQRSLTLPDLPALSLFVEFQSLKEQDAKFPELDIDEKGLKLLPELQKLKGSAGGKPEVALPKEKLLEHLKKNLADFDSDWVKSLLKCGILASVPNQDPKTGELISVRFAALDRTRRIHQRISAFTSEVR